MTSDGNQTSRALSHTGQSSSLNSHSISSPWTDQGSIPPPVTYSTPYELIYCTDGDDSAGRIGSPHVEKPSDHSTFGGWTYRAPSSENVSHDRPRNHNVTDGQR